MNKYNEKTLIQVIDKISRVKEYSNSLSQLETTDKDMFWKALKSIIKKSRDAQSEMIISALLKNDINHPMSHYGSVKAMAGNISAYDEILSMVDANADKCAEANTALKELEQYKTEITSNLEQQ